MPLRVGTDLVSVATVREMIATHAERYLERIYTERELTDCRTGNGLDAERLAGRFAAKEAALKVLRPDEQSVPWRTICVRKHPAGWIELELTGEAAALAEAAGVASLAVSISHEGHYASAVVVAEMRTP